jgi:hypothetical protein
MKCALFNCLYVNVKKGGAFTLSINTTQITSPRRRVDIIIMVIGQERLIWYHCIGLARLYLVRYYLPFNVNNKPIWSFNWKFLSAEEKNHL